VWPRVSVSRVRVAWQVVVIAYLCVILVKRPYIRKGDDRLHLLAQIEIFLLLLSSYVFRLDLNYDPVLDTVLSICLISTGVVFLAFLIPQLLAIIVKDFIQKKYFHKLCPCFVKHLERIKRVGLTFTFHTTACKLPCARSMCPGVVYDIYMDIYPWFSFKRTMTPYVPLLCYLGCMAHEAHGH
jgi:hypothetical protein